MPLPKKLQRAIDALLGHPGASEPDLRRAVLERNRRGQGQLSVPLREFVDKIAERPWTVSDDDFARLREAGYSDDQIYEITLSASLGSGLQRFDAGLRALEESR